MLSAHPGSLNVGSPGHGNGPPPCPLTAAVASRWKSLVALAGRTPVRAPAPLGPGRVSTTRQGGMGVNASWLKLSPTFNGRFPPPEKAAGRALGRGWVRLFTIDPALRLPRRT